MADKVMCLTCGEPLRSDQPYIFVEVRPFAQQLEPRREHTFAFHEDCYNQIRPNWFPLASQLDLRR